MTKYNVENLANIHRYHNELAREIDDADWMGSYEDTSQMRKELENVKECMIKGDVYYPLF
tara:strand:- start:2 stop:181 length:180 start_codon:yes stop_codon:yes gene_type:complete